jgi:hypothetical protein
MRSILRADRGQYACGAADLSENNNAFSALALQDLRQMAHNPSTAQKNSMDLVPVWPG